MPNISTTVSQALRATWMQRLEKNLVKGCNHPRPYRKEQRLGKDTGRKVCPICGDIK